MKKGNIGMMKRAGLLSVLLGMVALTGCQDTKKALGLAKVTPDENTVMERGSLVVPDNLHLRPPRTGDADEAFDASAKAQKILSGSSKSEKQTSSSEKDLLKRASEEAGGTDPNIRETMKDKPLEETKKDTLDPEQEKKKQGNKKEGAVPEEDAEPPKKESETETPNEE